MNIEEILVKSAEIWSEKIAVIDRHGAVKYSALFNDVMDLSRRLKELGVEPGHGIGIMAKNSREFITSAFAALQCRAVILPIHHQIKHPELKEVLDTCGIHAVIDDKCGIRYGEGPFYELQINGADPLRFIWIHSHDRKAITEFFKDAAYIRFTSGTTGTSKGVVVSHKGIMDRINAANAGFGLSHEDAVLCVLPMAFHFLVSTMLYLKVGATIILCPDHLAQSILNQANQHSATFLYASPMHYKLLTADRSGLRFKTLNRAVSTSSSLPPVTSIDFHKKFGIPVSQAYGIIEFGIPLMNKDNPIRKPASVGRALPGYEVSILDDTLAPVPGGAVGQLAFRGPGMFSGYLNPPRRAEEVLSDKWFLSGDQALMDEDGDITVVGRTKSMINVAGNKVFSEEVEMVVNCHPDIQMSRASGGTHPQMGEVVHLDIVLKDPSGEINIDAFMKFCRDRMSGYKIPHSVTVVKEINETLSGKISRVEI